MGRRKGSLNKKTIERMLKYNKSIESNNIYKKNNPEIPNNNESLSEIKEKESVKNDIIENKEQSNNNNDFQNKNDTLLNDVLKTNNNIEKETTPETSPETPSDTNTEKQQETSPEQSLLDDFLKFKEKSEQNTEQETIEQDTEQETEQKTEQETQKIYLPLEKQVKILDNIIVFILNNFLKQNIENISDEEVEFLCSLAGNDEVNLLPGGKNMFFLGLAAYYFSKIDFKKIFNKKI